MTVAIMGEWGRMNSGQPYGVLADDVDRALALAGLTSYEAVVVQQVREQSWGLATRTKLRNGPWPDALPAKVNYSDLARRLGYPCQRLYEARDRLQRARILVPFEDGVTINKEAHEWMDHRGEKRRLSDTEIAFATGGRPLRAFTENRECTTDEHSRKTVNSEPSAFTENRECAFTENRELHSRKTVNAEADRIIEDRPRVLRETKKIQEDEDAPACPDDLDAEFIQPGEHDHPRPEVERIWRLACLAFPGTSIPTSLNEHRRWHKAESWVEAIKQAKRASDATRDGSLGPGQKPFRSNGRAAWKFVEAIAARLDAEGITPDVPATRYPRSAPRREPDSTPPYVNLTDEQREFQRSKPLMRRDGR